MQVDRSAAKIVQAKPNADNPSLVRKKDGKRVYFGMHGQGWLGDGDAKEWGSYQVSTNSFLTTLSQRAERLAAGCGYQFYNQCLGLTRPGLDATLPQPTDREGL